MTAGSSRSHSAVKPRRSANSIVTWRRSGAKASAGVGQPLHHVGRHEALELALQLLQLFLGGQQQLLELVVLAPATQHEHGQAERRRPRAAARTQASVDHSSSIASRTVPFASDATPMASSSASAPSSAPSARVFC